MLGLGWGDGMEWGWGGYTTLVHSLVARRIWDRHRMVDVYRRVSSIRAVSQHFDGERTIS
jgi:hypothetical protein